MILIAIDPGTTESGYVLYNAQVNELIEHGIEENKKLAGWLKAKFWSCEGEVEHLAVEMVASYGMPVGREVFETCVWIGRFVEAFPGPHSLIYRRDVKLHLCGTARAKDGNIRAAIMDLYGGSRKTAIGTKSQPGPLHGVAGHQWAALAVSIYWKDVVYPTCL